MASIFATQNVCLTRQSRCVRRVKALIRPRALLEPDQLLTTVIGDARVPSAVKERLLVTFVKQQRELEQEHRALEQEHRALERSLQQEHRALERSLQQEHQKLEQELKQEMRERAQWQLAAKDAEFLVHARTLDLLVLKGCMNLRGVLEFVENEAKKSGAPLSISRFKLWKWILFKRPDLTSCIEHATSWDEQAIPLKIQSLYDTLNKHHHVGKTPAEWTAVGGLRIEEGAKLSILDCRLLYCICNAYGIKAEVVPAADVSD